LSPTFLELGVPAALDAALNRRGITSPFPVQVACLPDGLAGRDICGRAPTGSGKTLAFGIPMVARVGVAKPKRPRALVLVPTRELATQIHESLLPLVKAAGRSMVAVYGGVGYRPQLDALRRGVDILIACPGRLADLVDRNDVQLNDVDLVVLDEADRMADMGFLPEVRRLLDRTRAERQTLLFSATLDGDVDVLVKHYQRNPVRHDLVPDREHTDQATHVFWAIEKGERIERAAALIVEHGSTIIFTRTRHGADRLAQQLEARGVSAAPMHGGRSQPQRDHALRQFTRGSARVLVATDVAARGIDVNSVACVVHFDPAENSKDYVHRSGRTGRAGAAGLVVSFVGREDRGTIRGFQKALGLAQVLTMPGDETPIVERANGNRGRVSPGGSSAPRGTAHPRRARAHAGGRATAHR
jgi:superfamily II DNA/RNA helicase